MTYNESTVEYIRAWRSIKRDPITNESVFYTKWQSGEVTLEPLSNFYDEITYNDIMDEIVCDFIRTAEKSPNVKRVCLTCRKRVFNGNVFCSKRNGIGKCGNLKYRYS